MVASYGGKQMEIAPNSIIKILHNVPLDNTYDHTIYWSSAADQMGYFAGFLKPSTTDANFGPITFNLIKQSYQRVRRNYIRVEIPSDYLYDCNYLMFQNTSFGSRWFYAFIKSTEYVNNRVTEIEYELDVMQTWHFDYTTEDCFVEREHSVTDNIGDNTVPENLEIGDYLYVDAGNSFTNAVNASDFSLCVCAAWALNDVGGIFDVVTDSYPGWYNGIFSGLHYNIFGLNDGLVTWNKIIQFLSGLEDKRKEEIVAIFLMPTFLLSSYSPVPNPSSTGVGISKNKYTTWTTYTPRNKKLLTYPYNTLYVTSSDGDSAYFKYELFPGNTCNFMLEGAMGVPPEIGLTPVGYSFIGSPSAKNYNYTLSVKNFPMCSWTSDSFKAWLAQNSTRMMLGTGIAVANGIAGLSYVSASSGVSSFIAATETERKTLNTISTFGSVANILSQTIPAMLQPDHSRGVTKATLSMANDEFGYHYYYARIKDEFARIIDDYFDKFGYATRRVKQPNRNSRPCWNYVKTIGCTLTGSIPADDAKAICSIYDNGITFWRNVDLAVNPVVIGDYTQNNAPVGGGT